LITKEKRLNNKENQKNNQTKTKGIVEKQMKTNEKNENQRKPMKK